MKILLEIDPSLFRGLHIIRARIRAKLFALGKSLMGEIWRVTIIRFKGRIVLVGCIDEHYCLICMQTLYDHGPLKRPPKCRPNESDPFDLPAFITKGRTMGHLKIFWVESEDLPFKEENVTDQAT